MDMKRLFSYFACIGALFLTPMAAFSASGWTDHAQIAELTPTIHGRYIVQLRVSDNPGGCRSKDTFYQDYGTPGSEKMYLALLEAVASDKRVRVYVTGKCGLKGYSEISSVGIVP
jgi:hypothetical protein